MVVCPECGYPYPDDTCVVGVRGVVCANCTWKGSSTELLQIRGEFDVGVDSLQNLYLFLGRNIAPRIAVKGIELGFFSKEGTPENHRRIAEVLRRITRATFREMLQALIDDAKEHNDRGAPDGRTIH
jgi:hypothetical protein